MKPPSSSGPKSNQKKTPLRSVGGTKAAQVTTATTAPSTGSEARSYKYDFNPKFDQPLASNTANVDVIMSQPASPEFSF